MATAQLETMRWNENGPDTKLGKVLDNMHYVREQYKNKVVDHSMWKSNVYKSIGLSSKFSACQSNR